MASRECTAQTSPGPPAWLPRIGTLRNRNASARLFVVKTALPERGRYSLLSEVPDVYEPPASSHSFARNSLASIPMARAVVSARLSLGPRSMPIAASREASKSAGDGPGTAGGGSFRNAFSSVANRDLSFDCIPRSAPSILRDGRSPTARLFPHLIDNLKGDAARSVQAPRQRRAARSSLPRRRTNRWSRAPTPSLPSTELRAFGFASRGSPYPFSAWISSESLGCLRGTLQFRHASFDVLDLDCLGCVVEDRVGRPHANRHRRVRVAQWLYQRGGRRSSCWARDGLAERRPAGIPVVNLLTGGLRRSLCRSRCRLLGHRLFCRRFLDAPTLLRRLCWYRLAGGLRSGRCGFLCGCGLRLRCFR